MVLVFVNYHKAYFVIEEIVSAGFLQESDKKAIIQALKGLDNLLKEEKEMKGTIGEKCFDGVES